MQDIVKREREGILNLLRRNHCGNWGRGSRRKERIDQEKNTEFETGR